MIEDKKNKEEIRTDELNLVVNKEIQK